MINLNKVFSIIIVLLAITSFSQGHAATPNSKEKTKVVTQAEILPDKHNRRSPKGTVDGFLAAIAEQDYKRAAAYIDLSHLSKANAEKNGISIAENLQHALDHSGKLVANVLISESTTGNTEDNLDLDLDNVGTITIKDKFIPILVKQIKDKDKLPVWLFSSETIKKLPKKVKEQSRLISIDSFVPNFLMKSHIIGVTFGHWITVLIILLVAFLVARFFILMIVAVIKKYLPKLISHEKIQLIVALSIPARMWLSVYLFIISMQYFSIPITLRQHFKSVAIAVYLVAFLILLWQITNIAHAIFLEKFKDKHSTGLLSVVDFIRRSIRFILIAAGLLIGLHLYDHNVTAGLAALGIGGLAIALGAQKTLENIAGSINVVADRTVSEGDFCRFDDTFGFIEEVGIRSTKIRTLARTLVTIPNAEFSTNIIENFSKIDRFLFNEDIGIRYETTPDQIRYLLTKLRELFYSHPKVCNENVTVKFFSFGADSLNIKIKAYLKTNDYSDFLDIKEDLNLRVMEIVSACDIGFAFPSQTVYLAKDCKPNEQGPLSAEKTIKQWREQNKLQFPKFTENKINEISDSIDYPPTGSPDTKN